MARGRFITLEGGEGAGKSTQAKLLAEFLKNLGLEVLLTREPGGSPRAEEIRDFWLKGGEGEKGWDPLTESLLIAAARRQHLTEAIWPALERGVWVISDRYIDSTYAYQGGGLGEGQEAIAALYQLIAGDFMPELTLLLDVPVEVGLGRAQARGTDDRYERMDAEFHARLRAAFLARAKADPVRVHVIDASREVSAIQKDIATVTLGQFGLTAPAASAGTRS